MGSDNKIKCVNCGSDNAYICLGNSIPNKFGYRCRDCTASWSDSQ